MRTLSTAYFLFSRPHPRSLEHISAMNVFRRFLQYPRNHRLRGAILTVVLLSVFVAAGQTSAQQSDAGGGGGRGGRGGGRFGGRGGRGGTQPVVVAKVTRKDVP